MRALFNLPAPAKINWFLHITGRRADGYHTLQTVFQFIDWCDSIDLVRRDDGVIRRLGADDLPEDDLCVRAARLLQQTTQSRLGVDIHLRKSIPQQAGLGGGSSDAATVLIGLNRLWDLGLSRQALMRLGLQLGADLPVFLFGRNAWAQGVGEELQAIALPTPWFAVVHPGRGLSTRAVFGATDLTTPKPAEKISGFAEWLTQTQTHDLHGDACGGCLRAMWGRNDLQQGATALSPAVSEAAARLREVLVQQGLRPCFDVRMSGSGSAVFAMICEPVRHGEIASALPQGWQGRLCRGLDQHPLLHWIDA
ncbi:MAG: 4-(cytidine 5'-diphospho)-2-C-methyl-D-erythritol kinase [Thiomonas sp.]